MTFIEYQSKLSLNQVRRVGALHQVRVILADSTPTISKKKNPCGHWRFALKVTTGDKLLNY